MQSIFKRYWEMKKEKKERGKEKKERKKKKEQMQSFFKDLADLRRNEPFFQKALKNINEETFSLEFLLEMKSLDESSHNSFALAVYLILKFFPDTVSFHAISFWTFCFQEDKPILDILEKLINKKTKDTLNDFC